MPSRASPKANWSARTCCLAVRTSESASRSPPSPAAAGLGDVADAVGRDRRHRVEPGDLSRRVRGEHGEGPHPAQLQAHVLDHRVGQRAGLRIDRQRHLGRQQHDARNAALAGIGLRGDRHAGGDGRRRELRHQCPRLERWLAVVVAPQPLDRGRVFGMRGGSAPVLGDAEQQRPQQALVGAFARDEVAQDALAALPGDAQARPARQGDEMAPQPVARRAQGLIERGARPGRAPSSRSPR